MKKFKTQLFVSVSLFLCIILSFLAFAEPDGENYFKNGTFENSFRRLVRQMPKRKG